MTPLARNSQQIGSALRRARKKLGWSQQVLSQKTNLRQETISLIETGHSAARIDTLLTLLAALDLEFQIAPRSKAGEDDWV